MRFRRQIRKVIALGLIVIVIMTTNWGVIFGFYNDEQSLNQSWVTQSNSKRSDDWELPIMKSHSKGFRPVYVYSKAKPLFNKENYSQANQDRLILGLMKANNEHTNSTSFRQPYFVDLAANDAYEISNTYLLELGGWEGLCIEPNPRYWYSLASYRKCTVVGAFVGGTEEEDGKQVDVKIAGDGGLGGIVGSEYDNKGGADAKRNIVSITTILKETKVPSMIDYFSLDIEGAESLAMKGFSWDLYTMRFLTVERPKPDLTAKLKEKGYKMVAKIASWDDQLWIHEASVSFSVEEARKIVMSINHGKRYK